MSSWSKCGSQMRISGNSVSKEISREKGCNSAYGSSASEGQHEWKIKFTDGGQWGDIMTGISSNTNYANGHCWERKDNECYLLHGCDGYLYTKKGRHGPYPNCNPAPSYGTNDILAVCLDFEARTVSFKKNGRDLGIAFTEIPVEKYWFTIGLLDKGQQIEMISYSDESDLAKESKEEKQETNLQFTQDLIKLMMKQNSDLKQDYSSEKLKKMSIETLRKTAKVFVDLDEELLRLQEQLLETQQVIQSEMKVNESKYPEWSMKQVEVWLLSLEDGRYQKYVNGLLSGFAKDKIQAADLPDLDQGDLRSFGVGVFTDRRDLKKALNMLKQSKNIAAAAIEC